MKYTTETGNFLLRLNPLQRILLSVFIAGIIFFIIKKFNNNNLLDIISTWCAFAFSYVLTSWIVMFTRKLEQIKKMAKQDDGSRIFVVIFTIVASFAAMVTVLLLVITSNAAVQNKMSTILMCFFSVCTRTSTSFEPLICCSAINFPNSRCASFSVMSVIVIENNITRFPLLLVGEHCSCIFNQRVSNIIL